MKNKNKNKKSKTFNIIGLVVFICAIILFIALTIFESSHVCEFNRAFPSRCDYQLLQLIVGIYNVVNFIYTILLFISIVLLIICIVHNFKNKKIKYSIIYIIMCFISIILFIYPIYNKIYYGFNSQRTYNKKPIIYIYPEKESNLTIKLGNDNLLTHTYPKYNSEWNVKVNTDGNIYDYKTNRNYYALYWEGIDNSKIDMSEGFVIKGTDTTKFLEEKLEYLGLNEREIEEFIIYWLPKMENSKYNYIRFRTTDEINKYMPLYVSEKPDTLIRIIMDFKPLNKKIKVKKQKLNKQERNGFTIVEWGAREL